mmetsp:Transcript_2654/g.6324  ORF Transcript_2654/g.6324 Transcript_2654/m.6324 type:complete len:312 (-) Transcript_2654:78-1013(-)
MAALLLHGLKVALEVHEFAADLEIHANGQALRQRYPDSIIRTAEPPVAPGAVWRAGLPLFEPDAAHSLLLSKGLRPAFPGQDDLPEGNPTTFDSFYIADGTDPLLVHRITVSRRAVRDSSFPSVIFIDGHLVAIRGIGPNKGFSLAFTRRFDSLDLKGAAMETDMFVDLGGKHVRLVGDAEHTWLWRICCGMLTRTPASVDVYVNGTSARTHEDEALIAGRSDCCPRGLSCIILWPFAVLWVLFAFLFGQCIAVLCCRRKGKFRKFTVEPLIKDADTIEGAAPASATNVMALAPLSLDHMEEGLKQPMLDA